MITIDLSQVPTNALEQELNRRKQEAVTARKANEKTHVCTVCRGSGKTASRDPFSGYTDDVKCYSCDGTGSVRF